MQGVVNGSRDQLYQFWDPLHISGRVEARNVKIFWHACWWKRALTKQEIRSIERVSAQCVAFRMPIQVVMYWGRNLQRCKQFPRYAWRESQILNVGHVTPSRPCWPNFAIFSLVPPVANLCAKFEVSIFNRSRYMEGSQSSKSRSRDPSRPLLT